MGLVGEGEANALRLYMLHLLTRYVKIFSAVNASLFIVPLNVAFLFVDTIS
jgi:hypothetical protein